MEDKSFDIFNISAEDLKFNDEKKTGNTDLYTPKPDQGKEGTYKALIRFLPNINKVNDNPILKKYYYWLEDEKGGFIADCPSTIGEHSILQKTFFSLRNSESAVDQENSKIFSRKIAYYSLIQIVKDEQNPDLEGKIKIFKFGQQIMKKIDSEINVSAEFGETPINVTHPFEGKDFQLIINKKAGFPNYESSKFSGSSSPMRIPDDEGNLQKIEKQSKENKDKIIEYLKENSPSMDNFEYTPWTSEMEERIKGIISKYTSPGENIENIKDNNGSSFETDSSNKNTQDTEEDDDLDAYLKELENN